jgi:hypothetical protein
VTVNLQVSVFTGRKVISGKAAKIQIAEEQQQFVPQMPRVMR